MYWHLELILEFSLLCILWIKPAPRWFSILIGVDFTASLLQLLPYRAGLRSLPALIWEAGIVLALPLGSLALIEAGEMERGKRQYWHLRLLASWFAGRLCIISLQTQPALVIPLNRALLALDAAAFVAWSVLFLV